MFVQISVAGVVVLFILSGIFIPDEFFQRITDELIFDDEIQDYCENNSESITLCRKESITSNLFIDVVLAATSGFGTILTALLSYRYGHGRLTDWKRRIIEFIKRRNTEGRLNVNFIMPPSLLHETSSTRIDEIYSDTDEVVYTTTPENSTTLVTDDEPRYKTLEARLLAVEGNLMRDIDSRMKIFEQQLEEFRKKMRGSNEYETMHTVIDSIVDTCDTCTENSTADTRYTSTDNSTSKTCDASTDEFKTEFDHFEPTVKPSTFLLEDVTTDFKTGIPKIVCKEETSSVDKIGDVISQSTSKENLSTISGNVTQGDYSTVSSETGTEKNSETGSMRKSRFSSKIRTSGNVIQGDHSIASKETKSKLYSETGSTRKSRYRPRSTVNGNTTQGDHSNVSSETGTELNSETGSKRKSRITPRKKLSPPKSYLVNQTQNIHSKSETKSDQMMLQETPGKPSSSTNTSSSNKKNDISPPRTAPLRRGQQRSRQQVKAILQQTNEKLIRAKAKNANN